MWCKIPNDVLVDIFSRLPLKSLLRLRFVCKSWYTLITHPSTFNPPFNRTIAHNHESHKLLLLRQSPSPNGGEDFYPLNFDNETLDEYKKLESPFSDRSMELVGSCNGLLCLTGDDQYGVTDTVVLWNPCIRKHLTLPKPTINSSLPFSHIYVYGFGHDRKTNDYKVVRILHLPRDTFDWFKDGHVTGAQAPLAEVYSLSEQSWRSIETTFPYPYVIDNYGSPHALINGAVHWIVRGSTCKSGVAYMNSIVLFDVGDESFREMMVPDSVYFAGPRHRICLMVFGESLALIEYSSLDLCDQSCCVWVMNEYGQVDSWTKKYTICFSRLERTWRQRNRWEGNRWQRNWREGNWWVIGFPEDNSVLVIRFEQELVTINPTTQGIKSHASWSTPCSIYSYDYKESLVLLREVDEALLGHSLVLEKVGISGGGITERTVAEVEEQARMCPKVKECVHPLIWWRRYQGVLIKAIQNRARFSLKL